jgi:ABC transport system ATP-binding/permease protein
MAWLAAGSATRELREGDTVVGSGADADWRISTADLMPRHFVVSLRGGQALVRSSSNETVVVLNGNQLVGAPQPLADGEVVYAGSGRFVFSVDAPRILPVEEPVPGPAFLVDEHAKLAHPLISRSTTIGRDASNAIVVRDPTASRFHAEIRREAGGFALHSMGAAGTVVNAKTVITPCMLGEGDSVEIAYAKLRFTRRPLAPGISIAPPHETPPDEATRKPTLGSERIVVDAGNEAGRDNRRVQVVVALLLVLGAVLWLTVRG